MKYFLKELVSNSLCDKNGIAIRFEHGADDMGHIALDENVPEQKQLIDELLAYRERRQGGVFEVDEARYLSEKKKPTSSKRSSFQVRGPRLFEQKIDLFGTKSQTPSEPAQPAAVVAPAVTEPVKSAAPDEPVKTAKKFVPRTAKKK